MTVAQENPFAVLPGPVDYGAWEFTASRNILLDLCEHAVAVVPAREERPDLASFQVRAASPGGLRVAATDTEHTVIAQTEAVSYAGTLDQAYIPGRRLLAILREIPDGGVTVSVHKNTASITAAGAYWTLQLPGSAAYPDLPAPSAFSFTPYSREKLQHALAAVRHAVCRDSSLANLTQVQVIPGNSSVASGWVTASDGDRLARAELPGFPEAFCIPVSALDDLMRLLTLKVPETGIAQTDKLVVFRAGHVVYAAAKHLIPFPPDVADRLAKAQSNADVLSVDAAKLSGVVRRVRIAADAGTAAMAMLLQSASVTVTARDDGGTALEEIPAAWKGTPGRLVVVSHVALSEALAAHPEPVCEFRLGPDVGKRRSVVYLAGGGVIQVLTQLPPALVGL